MGVFTPLQTLLHYISSFCVVVGRQPSPFFVLFSGQFFDPFSFTVFFFQLCSHHCSKAIQILGLRKAFYWQRIPESSCARKQTVDRDILVTSRNGDRKTLQSIRITSRPILRKGKWNQLIQLR